MKIKTYDFTGKETGSVEYSGLSGDNINEPLCLQYIRIYGINHRQGTSKTKDRGEVRGGGRKPYRQKGTGRARAGSTRSPIWVGGGKTHGPKPRDWSAGFTRKMQKAVEKSAFADKILKDGLGLFEYPENKKISTGDAQSFLEKINKTGKILVIHDDIVSLYKSFRNIPHVNVVRFGELCAYDVLASKEVLIEKKAFDLVSNRIKE
ncbi:50S ribosomal protein L4 [candidate division WWE3 bacterium RIFCSPLOWO2_01_FULL_39_13]|uniref:Large ribosomal subunit protein uL4 n=1 Tax=candidate division WWE3 bacterium RIFCSPLOWO2_01_FULL_39_13 TaxID=1802624 RepID=A0A1F4V4Z9_UNCKA|nr:MAG: 50S ribosomal protein L4 [candidate division WWE3 bacterium RIFCSPLOWO2_01_FULL_39_13]